MARTRSFLKWAGSKYNCLNNVLPHLASGHRLIEPFAGSGVIFMNTNYSSYLLGENNYDLISLFSRLKQGGEDFIDYCHSFFIPENNCKERYYQIRAEFNQLEYSDKRAAYFLYLNKHGYNGLCRYNSKGGYNVPFGLYVKPHFSRNQMLLFYKKSVDAEFLKQDFRESFALAEPGDVVYCDPPYVAMSESTPLIAYTKNKFLEQDQIELVQLAEETAARGIPVILSNHDTPFTRHHYKNAQIHSFPVSRFINCQKGSRQPVKELVAVFG